jgi:hypothetical protein
MARRKRIGKGIYRDAYGVSGTVKVAPERALSQREASAFRSIRR